MIDPFDRLDALLLHVWDRLARGAADADDPFRLVALATSGRDGPEARTVALRRADMAAAEIEVHSDLRTAKVSALRTDPRAAVLAWDARSQLQVRLGVAMTIFAGDPVRWAQVPEPARSNYGTDPAPGTAVTDPGDVARVSARERFAALVGSVRSLDVVSLAHEPHRRARFDADGARWVAP